LCIGFAEVHAIFSIHNLISWHFRLKRLVNYFLNISNQTGVPFHAPDLPRMAQGLKGQAALISDRHFAILFKSRFTFFAFASHVLPTKRR